MLLQFSSRMMEKRNSKQHKKLNVCNDCGEVMYPLYQISILNLIFYLIVGVLIAVFWNIFLGIVILLGSIYVNVKLIRLECSSCRSYNIELYEEVPPTKFQQDIERFDKNIETTSENLTPFRDSEIEHK